jgi:hypothetical protein
MHWRCSYRCNARFSRVILLHQTQAPERCLSHKWLEVLVDIRRHISHTSIDQPIVNLRLKRFDQLGRGWDEYTCDAPRKLFTAHYRNPFNFHARTECQARCSKRAARRVGRDEVCLVDIIECLPFIDICEHNGAFDDIPHAKA